MTSGRPWNTWSTCLHNVEAYRWKCGQFITRTLLALPCTHMCQFLYQLFEWKCHHIIVKYCTFNRIWAVLNFPIHLHSAFAVDFDSKIAAFVEAIAWLASWSACMRFSAIPHSIFSGFHRLEAYSSPLYSIFLCFEIWSPFANWSRKSVVTSQICEHCLTYFGDSHRSMVLMPTILGSFESNCQ